MQVICYLLTGQKYSFSFADDTPIGKVMFDIGESKKFAPLNQIKFLHKGKLLETLGLTNPIKNLEEDGIVKIHCLLRLGAAPYSVAKLRSAYWSFVIFVLESGNFTHVTDMQIKNFSRYVDEFENMYRHASAKESNNDEDPITLEDIKNGMYWIEDGKKFSMSYYSLVEYVKKFKYVDENKTIQIPSPFTQQPIPEPWRSDFLYIIED